MFGVDTTELLLIAVAALIFIGPKDLPKAMRAVGYWVGRVRGMARHFTAGVENIMREAELEEMEKKWREENERIMRLHPPEGHYPDPPPAPPEPFPIAEPVDDDPRPPAERPLP
jgi:sec-independent protein translocase protein TatB